MNFHNVLNPRRLGVAATAALALGVVAAAPADAAAPASASVANDTLTVTGTTGDDAIAVGLAEGDPNTLVVDFGNGTRATELQPRHVQRYQRVPEPRR